MTMAAANLEIREALAAASVREVPETREHVLWELEAALEQLHLQGYKHLPSTFPLDGYLERAQLTDIERGQMAHRKIATLIAVILDELLPQPSAIAGERRDNTERLLRLVFAAFKA